MPIYGCSYAYDTVDNDGVLVDKCGVVMKIEDNEATVKWGGDKAYTELVTRLKDYTGLSRVSHGGEIKTLPDASHIVQTNTVQLMVVDC